MRSENIEACPNCGKERWVAKVITGCLCGDCSRRSLEKRKKTSDTLKGYRPFRFNRGKKRGTRLGYKCSPEHIEKVRQNTLAQWRNPITRTRLIEANRLKALAQWRDPIKRERLIKSLIEMRSPNNMELTVLRLLNDNFDNEWQFVGDGQLIIGGLSPDFVNVNGKKLIVEFFGRHWHKPQEEHFKQKVYARFGYRTLVIWSEELKDEGKLVSRISDWVKAA